jgi:hypothetical protein
MAGLIKQYWASIESDHIAAGIPVGEIARAGNKDGVIRDFWDGNIFQRYLKQHLKLFSDPQSIALQVIMDGIPLVCDGVTRCVAFDELSVVF